MESLIQYSGYFVVALCAIGTLLYKRYKFLGREKLIQQIQFEKTPYLGLRKLALEMTPTQLGIDVEHGKNIVYGIIYDLGLTDICMTIAAYKTGDASLYTSLGGGILGGIKQEKIRNAVNGFIECGQTLVSYGIQVTNIDQLPKNGYANFYFLTSDGTCLLTEQIKNLEHGSSPFTSLFTQGDNLINQLRMDINID